MSKFKKTVIIFCAEYLVILQGIIFLVYGLQRPLVYDKIGVLSSGIILFLTALLITKIIKRIVHKRRQPKKNEYFIPFDRYAFPSAHSTALFSIAVFMISQNIMIGVLSFIVAFIIVIARVKSRVHDAMDIFGGFVIGVSVTYYCMPYVLAFVYSHLVPIFL